MEILTELVEFFDLSTLSSSATFVDLLSNFVNLFFAVFIVAFMIRTLFLACSVPFDIWD